VQDFRVIELLISTLFFLKMYSLRFNHFKDQIVYTQYRHNIMCTAIST